MMRCFATLFFGLSATACGATPAVVAPTSALLDLSQPASGTGVKVVFGIDLGADGRLAVDGEPIASHDELLRRARVASTQHADLRAIIRADRHVYHERVIAIMDRLKQAGISRIAFAVAGSAQPTTDAVASTPTLSSAGRPAAPRADSSWACAFPAESDSKGIDSAMVMLEVSIDAAGAAVGVRLLADPGSGFGRAAMQCALGQAYSPALDAQGTPYLAVTPPISVRFAR